MKAVDLIGCREHAIEIHRKLHSSGLELNMISFRSSTSKIWESAYYSSFCHFTYNHAIFEAIFAALRRGRHCAQHLFRWFQLSSSYTWVHVLLLWCVCIRPGNKRRFVMSECRISKQTLLTNGKWKRLLIVVYTSAEVNLINLLFFFLCLP